MQVTPHKKRSQKNLNQPYINHKVQELLKIPARILGNQPLTDTK